LTRARMLLFATGALSVLLAMMHFTMRTNLPIDPALRAGWDLVGLSMLFAGLVTVTVAWMALSSQLLSGYATLYGVYYLGHTWVLLFSGPSNWLRALAAFAMATGSFIAAWQAWTDRFEGPDQPLD